MKKIFLVLLAGAFLTVCFFMVVLNKMHRSSSGDISVRVKESEDVYQVSASYHRSQSRRIQHYIDAQLGTDHMFRNSKIDARVTLSDETNIYVRNLPGKLLIRLNKDENDAESYERIKKLGNGIQVQLRHNR